MLRTSLATIFLIFVHSSLAATYLTHSALDKSKIKESAQLIYIDKENADNTYQIDMALHGFCSTCEIGINEDQVGRFARLRYGPLIEAHRNSDIDPKKETNSIQAGGTVGLFIGDEEEKGLWLWDLILDGAYKRNELKDQESVIYNFTATIANNPIPFSSCNFGEYCFLKNNFTRWYIDPYVGLYGANIREGGTGHVEYTYSKVSLGIQPLYQLDAIGKDIEIVLKYSSWNARKNSGDFSSSDETPELKEASLIYWIMPPNDIVRDKTKHSVSNYHVGISFDYFEGANPQQDKPEQKYSQITFKFGFSL